MGDKMITDVLVYWHGVRPVKSGSTTLQPGKMVKNDANKGSEVMSDLDSLLSQQGRSGRQLVKGIWQVAGIWDNREEKEEGDWWATKRSGEEGRATNERMLGEAQEFIKSNYHPEGRLIIAGWSLGGRYAIMLCKKVPRFYNPDTGKLSDSSANGKPQLAFVELLITIDADCDPKATEQRMIPQNVKRNINYFHIQGSTADSAYGRNDAVEKGCKAMVDNKSLESDLSGIPEDQADRKHEAACTIGRRQLTRDLAAALK